MLYVCKKLDVLLDLIKEMYCMELLSVTKSLPLDTLSERETQVYKLLIFGCQSKQIASKLNISNRTVKFHSSNIYKKLNTRNKIELIVKAFQ